MIPSFSSFLNYTAIPTVIVQGALLHPYYEPHPYYRKIRALLAPLIILLALTSQSKRLWTPLEDYLHINYSLVAIPTFHIISLALQYATHRGIARKSDLIKLKKEEQSEESTSESDTNSSASITNSDSNDISSPSKLSAQNHQQEKDGKKSGSKKGPTKKYKKSKSLPPSFWELLRFSFWMTWSPRSLEYTWGPPTSVLSPAPRTTVTKFISRQFTILIINQIAVIACCVIALPATSHPQSPQGWFIDILGLKDSAWVRLFSRRILYGCWGNIGFHLFWIVGSIFNIFDAVMITLGHHLLPAKWAFEAFDTTLYPPIFNDLYSKTSIADFWGKGWQCCFRRDFVYLGAEPMLKLLAPCGPTVSKLGALLGAMLISGLMHEWGFIIASNTIDWTFQTTRFFVFIGLGIALEATFRQITGSRLRGFPNLVWVMFWCWVVGDGIMDCWLAVGLGTSGMKGPLEVNHWPLIKFLFPMGPILPDDLLSKISSLI